MKYFTENACNPAEIVRTCTVFNLMLWLLPFEKKSKSKFVINPLRTQHTWICVKPHIRLLAEIDAFPTMHKHACPLSNGSEGLWEGIATKKVHVYIWKCCRIRAQACCMVEVWVQFHEISPKTGLVLVRFRCPNRSTFLGFVCFVLEPYSKWIELSKNGWVHIEDMRSNRSMWGSLPKKTTLALRGWFWSTFYFVSWVFMTEYASLLKYLSKNVQVVTQVVNNKKVMAKTPREANLYGNWCVRKGLKLSLQLQFNIWSAKNGTTFCCFGFSA